VTDRTKARLMLEICSALRYLHDQRPPIIHGDLKPGNIMVEQPQSWKPQAKLLDFGLARKRTRHAPPLLGTLRWMAPEILVGLSTNQPCPPQTCADVFSFGAVCHFVVTGIIPFASLSKPEIVNAARTGVDVTELLCWPGGSAVSHVLRPLVGRCLNNDPQSRPQMNSIHEELLTSDPFDVLGVHQHARCVGWQRGICEALRARETPVRTGQLADRGYLLFHSFRPTPIKTQCLSLLHSMQQWNLNIGNGSCCEYHAQVAAMQKAINLLSCTGCRNSVLVNTGNWIQCCKCTAMQEAEEGASIPCVLCGHTDVAPFKSTMSL